MVSLLILKQLENLSDEVVVEKWVENPYYQFFSGEEFFQWEFPCHPTGLVYFRKRIGEDGAKKSIKYPLTRAFVILMFRFRRLKHENYVGQPSPIR